MQKGTLLVFMTYVLDNFGRRWQRPRIPLMAYLDFEKEENTHNDS